MQFIPTNDVFHHLTNILQLKDKELIIDMFQSQGIEASKSKINSWNCKTGSPSRNYREMPREALDAFINELYKRKFYHEEQR